MRRRAATALVQRSWIRMIRGTVPSCTLWVVAVLWQSCAPGVGALCHVFALVVRSWNLPGSGLRVSGLCPKNLLGGAPFSCHLGGSCTARPTVWLSGTTTAHQSRVFGFESPSAARLPAPSNPTSLSTHLSVWACVPQRGERSSVFFLVRC